MKPTQKIALSLLLVSSAIFAETPAFEVASIRPALAAQRRPSEGFFCPFGCFGPIMGTMTIEGSHVDIDFMGLDQLILTAYGIKPYQLAGPAWMPSQKFVIQAKFPAGISMKQVPEMLQALLAERFKLTLHRDSKEQPVHALVGKSAKNGSRLQKSTLESAPETPGGRTLISPQGLVRMGDDEVVTGAPQGPMRISLGPDGTPQQELLQVTMPGLAEALSQFMDRPVVDMTRLTGSYHVVLKSSDIDFYVRAKIAATGARLPRDGAPDPGNGPAAASDPSGGSIFKTIEKLGLKLERRKAPVPMLVVDHIEKTPTAN
ncbi:MAG TPA: TIGR03435 family protein [Bryobacteraceae bacterium]|nr:TIGR03435 family protein [Bryobacteraceae bacterium]